jgi:putative ABC transport system permease protein
VSLSLVLRLLWRESRGARGRMAFLVLCLVLGVGAVSGVSALVAAVDRGLRADSRELIAADLRVSSRDALPAELDALLEEAGAVASARVEELPTLIAAGPADAPEAGSSRLVNLKAAQRGYPFHGELVTEPAGLGVGDLGPDGCLVAAELAAALQLEPGDPVAIGGSTFHVRGAVLSEPDRLEFSMSLGPRVFVSVEGLERTSLLGLGSRVRHFRLVRLADGLDADALDSARRILDRGLEGLGRLRVETSEEAQPSVQRSLRNVERYLGLVALLSLLLGGVGVAQVVRTWIGERTQAVAVLRSLGMRPVEILRLYLIQVLVLALLASLLGVGLGLLLPLLGSRLAPDVLPPGAALAAPPRVVLRGLLLGLGIAGLFALDPLSAVYRVPPARVLRAEAQPLSVPRWMRVVTVGALLLGVLGSSWWQARDLTAALAFTGGLLALTLVLVLGARGVMALSARIPRERLPVTLRHGVAALARPGAGTVASVVALGLGVLVIATLLLVERRLADELGGELPPDAPSLFLVDVQPDQWEPVRRTLLEHGARHVDSTPVAMARLKEIGGVPVRELLRGSGDGRERWVLTREQRLTWRAELPASNTLVEGAWFDPGDGVAEVSLEARFAADLGAAVGDRLVLDLQGVPVELVVTSLREVDWGSFQINFFFVVEPGVLEEAPHWRLASAQLDGEDEQAVQDALVGVAPNVTVLRVRPLLEKVAALLARIAEGVRILGLFAVGAGLAILAGAVSAGGIRRAREVALLKALGLTRAGVAALFLVEYGLVGLVAGLCGAVGAYALAAGFVERLLGLDPGLLWAALPLFVLGTALLAGVFGLLGSWRALRTAPMATLR